MAASGLVGRRGPVWVTSSWDDGYPLDLRLAGLLSRYGIPATFYVPLQSELPVLSPQQIRDLSRTHEIAAHTIHHMRLDTVSPNRAREEIFGSKRRIEDLTGRACLLFCPPGGRYGRRLVAQMREAGYRGIRTVELMATGRPRVRHGLAVLPTTVQLHQHPPSTYVKNALKRGRIRNLITYLASAPGRDLPEMVDAILGRLFAAGGVFHLWGHSWELEREGLWPALEVILSRLQANRDRCRFVSNSELCELALSGPISSSELFNETSARHLRSEACVPR